MLGWVFVVSPCGLGASKNVKRVEHCSLHVVSSDDGVKIKTLTKR